MTDQNEYPQPESQGHVPNSSDADLSPYQQATQPSDASMQSYQAASTPGSAPYAGGSQVYPQAPGYGDAPMYSGGQPQAIGGPGGQQFATSTMHEPSQMAPVPFFKQETLGSWMVNVLLASLVPFGLWLFFMAFSDAGSEAKKQWARASLVMVAIGIVFVVLFWGVFASVLYSVY